MYVRILHVCTYVSMLVYICMHTSALCICMMQACIHTEWTVHLQSRMISSVAVFSMTTHIYIAYIGVSALYNGRSTKKMRQQGRGLTSDQSLTTSPHMPRVENELANTSCLKLPLWLNLRPCSSVQLFLFVLDCQPVH